MEVEFTSPVRSQELQPNPGKFEEPANSKDLLALWRLSGAVLLCLFTVVISGAILANATQGNASSWHEFVVSYLYGSTFAVMMLAAIWPALGSGRHRDRFGFSFIWNFALFIAVVMALAANDGFGPPQMLLMLVVMLVSAWLLPQAPLWAIQFFTGAKIEVPGRRPSAKANQFGIYHLLIFTSVVAVILGAGRMAFSLFRQDIRPDLQSVAIFTFIISCAATLALSLLIAMLIDRYLVSSVIIVLALVVAVGYLQHSLLSLMTNMQFGPSPAFFIGQTVTMAAWMAIFAFVLRRNGYRVVLTTR